MHLPNRLTLKVGSILAGSKNALAGIDVLRKICNHPDLLERATNSAAKDYGQSPRGTGLHQRVKACDSCK